MVNAPYMNHTEFNRILPNRAITVKYWDAPTRRSCNLSFGGHRGDHYDVTPTTPQDAEILEMILGFAADGKWGRRIDLGQWRARPGFVHIGGVLIPVGL